MKSPEVAARIFEALLRHYPDPDTELHHRNAFELLVATILSAQSTDQRVNLVTPALFRHYPDARALAAADTAALEGEIKSTGFFRQKSRALIGMATALVERHGGEVPADMDALTKLPGVGRKTANVVLGHALGVPGLPVDRHVLRVASRLGLTHADKPERVEADLTALFPSERWTNASDLLILHGRRICRPSKPLCQRCNAREWCDYFISGGAVVKANLGRPEGRPLRTREKGAVGTNAKGAVRANAKGPVARPSTAGSSGSGRGGSVGSGRGGASVSRRGESSGSGRGGSSVSGRGGSSGSGRGGSSDPPKAQPPLRSGRPLGRPKTRKTK